MSQLYDKDSNVTTNPEVAAARARGFRLVLVSNRGPVTFEADQEGLYWFEVGFEGERLTRMALRVQPGAPTAVAAPVAAPSPATAAPASAGTSEKPGERGR